MAIAYISLGSNLGNKLHNLYKAIELVGQFAGVVQQKSTIYETPPWGFESFNNFLNQVIEIETASSALELLEILLNLERKMGRIRSSSGYQDRSIDLDILFYDDEIINLPALQIPHPRLHERMFMLNPMVELNPGKVHPVLKKSVSALHQELIDKTPNQN